MSELHAPRPQPPSPFGDDLSDLISDALDAAADDVAPPEVPEELDELSASTVLVDPGRSAAGRRAAALYATGRSALAAGDLDAAQEAFADALRADPSEGHYAVALERVAAQLRDRDREQARERSAPRPVVEPAAVPAPPRNPARLLLGGTLGLALCVLGAQTAWMALADANGAGDLAATHADVADFVRLQRSDTGMWRAVLAGTPEGDPGSWNGRCTELAAALGVGASEQLLLSWESGALATCSGS